MLVLLINWSLPLQTVQMLQCTLLVSTCASHSGMSRHDHFDEVATWLKSFFSHLVGTQSPLAI